MSIFADESTRLLVQGITGREGSFHARQMLEYGTQVVAGVTPGKGGQVFEGKVPVFNTVADAVKATQANASVIYVPPMSAAAAIIEAADAGIELHIETHRDRMTTDLFFTLHLLDRFPDLRFTADLSHYVVGREFAWPIDDTNHGLIHRILDNSWGIHGRVASREQIQVQLNFPQHKDWVDLFMGWWEYGIRSWKKRAGPDATLTFLCELGPSPYAITGADGYELSDRWQEALQMKDMIRTLWRRIEHEG